MKTITIRRDSSCIPKSTICFLLPKRNPQCLLFLQTSLPQIQFFLKTPALLFWFPFNPFWRVTLVYYSEFFPSTFSLNVYESILFPIIAMEKSLCIFILKLLILLLPTLSRTSDITKFRTFFFLLSWRDILSSEPSSPSWPIFPIISF